MKNFAKKSLGQHFLIDQIIIEQILEVFYEQATTPVIEIGPGLGALTDHLIEHFEHITCIEIDPRATQILETKYTANQIYVINKDVLEIDFSRLSPTTLSIIGNLPYNISSSILFHLFNYLANIKLMFFMLQKEVVDRMAASPNNKDYGRLSIMCQVYCQVNKFFDIEPTAFSPLPKVRSAMVMLIPYKDNNYDCSDFKLLENIVKVAFNQRRKTIANNLKNIITKDQLLSLGIDYQLRPENLTVENYVAITNYLQYEKIPRD